MRRCAFPLLSLVVSGHLFAANWCRPTPGVQTGLDRLNALNDSALSYSERLPQQRKILEELIASNPTDPHAHLRYQRFARFQDTQPPGGIAERYQALRDDHPDDPVFLYLYAKALVDYKSDEAISHLKSLVAKAPDFALSHLALADLYAWGRLIDRAKAREHLGAYFGACPETTDSSAHSLLMRFADADTLTARAKVLRAYLEKETLPAPLSGYESLWDLEFKTWPPGEHPALRTRILADVQSIRDRVQQPRLALLRTVRQGYKLGNKQDGVDAVNREIVATAPQSGEAVRIATELWDRDHPRPASDSPDDQKETYYSARFTKLQKLLAQCPNNAGVRLDLFSTATMTKSMPADQFVSVVTETLGFVQRNQEVWSVPPFAMIAAREYLARNIAIEDVPRLSQAGFDEYKEREQTRHVSDRDGPEDRASSLRSIINIELDSIEQIAQAYVKLGKSEEAPALLKRIPQGELTEPWLVAARFRTRGRIAELEGKKLAAFTYFEKAQALLPRKDKKLDADVERLWKDLGGTEETWALRKESKATAATQASAWTAPEKPIPAFNLVDLKGKRWITDDLAGKKVLINVWATWCGPCIAEHPHFQKLYEQLKDRKDVAVISLNIDEEVGAVQPYMDQKKYGFPVLLGGSFVNSVLDRVSIPRNWLLDTKGVHRLEQVGFGDPTGWIESMISSINDMKTP